MKDLYIIGTGSQARYIIETCKNYNIKGLVDILFKENVGKVINDVEIVCFLDDITNFIEKDNAEVIIAYGNNQKKKEIAEMLYEKGFKFATIISEKSYISSYVEIGEGCVINPSVTIMPNVKIGNHVIIHSGCVIEHDNEIGDYANIAPGVITAGNVKVGSGSFVYTRACIVPKIKIGNNAIVGAGAVVLKDVEDNTVVAGVPAKKIR